MAVVAAFVGNAGRLRAVGERDGLVYGQRVHIRPEGDPAAGGLATIHTVKPSVPPKQLHRRRIFLQKRHETLLRFPFPSGKLRMGMQRAAQGHGFFKQ